MKTNYIVRFGKFGISKETTKTEVVKLLRDLLNDPEIRNINIEKTQEP